MKFNRKDRFLVRSSIAAIRHSCQGRTASHAAPIQWTSASGGNDHFYELVFPTAQGPVSSELDTAFKELWDGLKIPRPE